MQSLTIKELLEAGAHFGHKRELSHPGMNEYIFTVKDKISVIDLEKTLVKMDEANKYLKKMLADKKTVLFVATKQQAKELVKNLADKLKMPYVNYRWLGGTMTNFETIKVRIKKYNELRKQLDSDDFKKMSKKQQISVKKEVAKLDKFFMGLKDIEKLPDALFIVDPTEEHVAVSEARKIKIPIVAIGNTNTDKKKIDILIPANDNAPKTLELLIGNIEKNIK